MADGNTKSKPAKEKAAPTDYVVLELCDLSDDASAISAWQEVGILSANGTEKTLIEKWAAEQKRTGAFKLVPARSWRGGVRVFEQTSITSEAIA